VDLLTGYPSSAGQGKTNKADRSGPGCNPANLPTPSAREGVVTHDIHREAKPIGGKTG